MKPLAWTTGLVVALSILRSMSQRGAEIYASRVFDPLSHILAPMMGSVPWSWSMVALASCIAWVGLAVARRRGWRRSVPPVIALLALWTGFLGIWGFHYQRAPLEVRVGLTQKALNQEVPALEARALEALALELAAVVAATEPLIGPLTYSSATEHQAVAAIAASVEALTWELDGRSVRVSSRVKHVPAGIMLAFGSSGVISPWLLEAHIDRGLPAPARIAVAAHELAHLAGFAREDEAEAVGAIAGLRAADPLARYSVALFQLAAVARDLPEASATSLIDGLPERARADLWATRRAADAYSVGWLDDLRRASYDRYLRSQGVGEGIQSYAASTRLLARLWTSDAVSLR